MPSVATAESFSGINGRIMYADVAHSFSLHSIRDDGTGIKDITSDANAHTDAEYSPDGTKIVYRQIISSVDQVVVANADGSNPQTLTSGPDFSFTPSWSPDGTKIAYIHQVSSVQHIYRMNADGSNKTQLTSSGSYFDPEYSPDGTKIVALLDDTDNEVVVMNADGSTIVNLTNNSVDDYKANWSPDGSKLVYASTVSGSTEIFTMSPDGSNKTQRTTAAQGYRSPVYSPDGTKIALIDSPAPGTIYLMDAASWVVTPITNSPWPADVSWQPLTHTPTSPAPNPTVSLTNGKATIDIAATYSDSYEGIDKTKVTATSTPASGTTSVDTVTGVITYSAKTAAAHSTSLWNNLASMIVPQASAAATTDSFTYRVCSLANSSLCVNGTITVQLLAAPSTGAGQANSTSYLALPLAIASAVSIWLGIRKLRSRHQP